MFAFFSLPRFILLLTLGQRLAQVGIRTEIEGRLILLVLDGEIRSVGGQEAGNGRGRLLVSTLAA